MRLDGTNGKQSGESVYGKTSDRLKSVILIYIIFISLASLRLVDTFRELNFYC